MRVTVTLSNMPLIIRLAFRNLGRNKRRTFLTIAAITFALILSIVMRGIQLGTYETNIKATIESSSSYIQLQRVGYQKNPSLRKSFIYDEAIEAKLRTDTDIVGFATRINGDGLASFKDKSQPIFINAVDPTAEFRVSNFHKRVKGGRFIQPGNNNEIVVGHILLENLGANIGDSIVMLAQGLDGFLRNSFAKIVGVAKFGSADFDRMVVFVNLKTAQELLGMDSRVSVVAISLSSLRMIDAVRNNLRISITDPKIAVHSWGQVLPELKEHIDFDNLSGVLYLFILFLIVGFGMFNTVLMSVTERSREFGMMLSLGMSNTVLARIIAWELFFISLICSILGNIIGGSINYYIVRNPIQLSGDIGALYEEYGFLPVIVSMVEPYIFIESTLIVVFIALIVIIYPLWRVYKLEPLKGIRHT